MRQLGAFEFPTRGNRAECDAWKPTEMFRSLHTCVIAAARSRIEGAWSAYIKAVPGLNHRAEWRDVLVDGAKLSESIARAIFPAFDGVPYAD